MSAPQDHPILLKQIEDLPVSEGFRLDFLRAGFETLKEALEFEADTLISEKKFTYHTIIELINLLDAEGLGGLLND